MMSNRGTQVWPPTGARTDCVDHYRCRFLLRDGARPLTDAAVLGLLEGIGRQVRWMHVERLAEIDGEPSFTRAQGEN